MYDFKKLSLDVCNVLDITQKNNPGVKKALRDFDKEFINKLIQKNKHQKNKFTKKELEIINKLNKPKYGPLVYEIENEIYIQEKISENVRIRYVFESDDCLLLAKQIRTECIKRGCNCSIIPLFEDDQKDYLSTIPEKVLFEINPLSVAIVKNTDVSIFIGDETDPNWSRGLEDKIALGSKTNMMFRKIYDKCNIRGALLSLPVKRKKYYVSEEKYTRVFYESLTASFSKEMDDLVNIYENKLKNTKNIRITANDGTDISFSIKGRKILRDYLKKTKGNNKKETYNFPTGEVFVAPVETTANGKIIFDYVTPRGFGLIEKLCLVFKDGKVVEYSAKDDGAEKFKEFLDTNTGEKDRIGEFGIGCNPKAEYIGTTIVDEKIFGSIHIAIGFNLGSFCGKNQASSHQDMIKIMKGRDGCVYADNKLIMKNGMPN